MLPIAQELIARLDQPAPGQAQLRTIPLANADANTVNNVLRSIFNEKIRSKTLQISAEPLTNSLIVGGTQKDFEEIEKWALELDEQSLVKRGVLEIVDVLNANPWEVVNILNAQYGARKWGQRNKIGQEFSFYIVAGRSVAVQAPEDKLPEILDLIAQLDAVGVDKIEVRTYELAGIGAGINDLARQVTNAVNSQQQARERRVTITPYPAADTLIVTARTDQFEQIEEMMDKFKAMVEKETTVTKFIKLQYLDAQRYASTIQNMLANKIAKEGRRGSRSMQNLQILPDPRTNRLICYLPEKIVADLDEVIKELDVEAEDYEGQLRVIELAHADASSVAQTLRPMFEQRGRERRQQDFSQIIVRIQPETITNSLLVTASDEDFEQIKKMAIEIDEKALVQGNEPKVIDLRLRRPGRSGQPGQPVVRRAERQTRPQPGPASPGLGDQRRAGRLGAQATVRRDHAADQGGRSAGPEHGGGQDLRSEGPQRHPGAGRRAALPARPGPQHTQGAAQARCVCRADDEHAGGDGAARGFRRSSTT